MRSTGSNLDRRFEIERLGLSTGLDLIQTLRFGSDGRRISGRAPAAAGVGRGGGRLEIAGGHAIGRFRP
jgi:hypothetical protein